MIVVSVEHWGIALIPGAWWQCWIPSTNQQIGCTKKYVGTQMVKDVLPFHADWALISWRHSHFMSICCPVFQPLRTKRIARRLGSQAGSVTNSTWPKLPSPSAPTFVSWSTRDLLPSNLQIMWISWDNHQRNMGIYTAIDDTAVKQQ